MANLKGARTCLEILDMKPNYSKLGRIYGIDRKTTKKKYNGIENKKQREKHSYLDKYINIIKEKCNILGTTKNEIIFNKNKTAHVLFETDYGFQLQFDWKGPIKLHTKNEEIIEFYIFSTTLGASRFHTFFIVNL